MLGIYEAKLLLSAPGTTKKAGLLHQERGSLQ